MKYGVREVSFGSVSCVSLCFVYKKQSYAFLFNVNYSVFSLFPLDFAFVQILTSSTCLCVSLF